MRKNQLVRVKPLYFLEVGKVRVKPGMAGKVEYSSVECNPTTILVKFFGVAETCKIPRGYLEYAHPNETVIYRAFRRVYDTMQVYFTRKYYALKGLSK